MPISPPIDEQLTIAPLSLCVQNSCDRSRSRSGVDTPVQTLVVRGLGSKRHSRAAPGVSSLNRRKPSQRRPQERFRGCATLAAASLRAGSGKGRDAPAYHRPAAGDRHRQRRGKVQERRSESDDSQEAGSAELAKKNRADRKLNLHGPVARGSSRVAATPARRAQDPHRFNASERWRLD
jgi:hypothetical protein